MVELKWLGHAAWEISSKDGVLLIDPFLSGNPLAPFGPEAVQRCDGILVSHDHSDHFGDAPELAKKLGAPVVAMFETAAKAEQAGAKAIGANIGGTVTIAGFRVTLVPALHSGGSNPSGFIVETEGIRIYHAGDTGLSLEMQLIGQLYRPSIALLPIGGHYTMDPAQAAQAIRLLKPRVAIPMHYNTWPPISQDPKLFEELVRRAKARAKVIILKPGESYKYEEVRPRKIS
ncbi:MAG: metal-dependent hydrolase [Nitrososphaerota archaeon]